MNLNEAKAILSAAQDTMRYGGQQDMLCHVPGLVNALEFMVTEYAMLMLSELDEVALIQHQFKMGNDK